jgi:hypothetical protein
MEMADEIIKELWIIKDKIAGEYGYDVKALVDHLRTKKHREDQLVADLRSLKQTAKSVKEEVGTSSPPQHSR